jgi:uncharacterized protein (TIGR04255 family)
MSPLADYPHIPGMPFRPYRAANSIVRAAFACEFSQPFDSSTLEAIGDLHSRVRERLPQKILVPGVTFRLTPGSRQPQPVQVVGGVAFSSYGRDGTLEKQLNAMPTLIAFTEFHYSRWKEVWAEAKEMLSIALEGAEDSLLSAFGLEYQDRFIAEADSPQPVDFVTVLRTDGKYLPGAVFEASDVWHANCGTVQPVETPCPHNQNDSINVALARRSDLEAPRLAIEITAQHRRVLQPPMSTRDALQWIEPLFDNMHRCNKTTMVDLLTPETRERINLSGEQV